MDTFSAPHFTDRMAAVKFLEGLRWPSGTVCPHCGTVGKAYACTRLGKTGKPPAYGVYRCASKECRADFSVTTGTVMERSHIPLHKWLRGFYMMAASKKGISAHQLHRTLGITYKAAWFMAHRIREAMRTGGLEPMGGEGKTVEADETYFGKRTSPYERNKRKPPFTNAFIYFTDDGSISKILWTGRCGARDSSGFRALPPCLNGFTNSREMTRHRVFEGAL